MRIGFGYHRTHFYDVDWSLGIVLLLTFLLAMFSFVVAKYYATNASKNTYENVGTVLIISTVVISFIITKNTTLIESQTIL